MSQNDILTPERLYGVLGLPLGQSLSPALHSRFFARVRHPGVYLRWEKSAEELPAFFQAVRGLPIAGLSVTAPHKEAVIPFLDGLCPRAKAVGAVNTVYWAKGLLMGDNTDVAGFLAPLERRGGKLPALALVLGSGGAARAVLAGLGELSVPEITLCSRNRTSALELARRFGCMTLDWEERQSWLDACAPALIVNATPLGMKGVHEKDSPLNEAVFAAFGTRGRTPASFIAYDIVYNPRRTRFLTLAGSCGLETLDGLGFFAAQAEAQLTLWTGARLDEGEACAFVRPLLV